MAFERSSCDETIEVDQFHSDGRSHAMQSKLGVDMVCGKTYFAYVGLEIMIGGTDHELIFFIQELDHATGTTRDYWCGLDTKRLFPKQTDRAWIVRVACELTCRLLQMTKPVRVYRVTHDDYPPDKALDKHERVTAVFIDCGYTVTRCDSYERKRVWWADKGEDRS
ncbi:hypothetical protein MTBLM5_60131 [Magnetospirillum sp. LM-5]|uniref:hypothetical protein n=1 Tax=Magnetospirillum sp. LM-5 TaxID=2681466 RepID=UPI001380F3FC|nr:hypothetical protein [Magnetospirillum sp. LM-5]CAA7624005.1 hypothetical protein MTBLM5_60131 [Magnetospirillum sp. LM-5]